MAEIHPATAEVDALQNRVLIEQARGALAGGVEEGSIDARKAESLRALLVQAHRLNENRHHAAAAARLGDACAADLRPAAGAP